jgi:hypothetical protein
VSRVAALTEAAKSGLSQVAAPPRAKLVRRLRPSARIGARARAGEVEDFIHFTGYRKGETLLAYLSAFDIGLIPDPLNETSPHEELGRAGHAPARKFTRANDSRDLSALSRNFFSTQTPLRSGEDR